MNKVFQESLFDALVMDNVRLTMLIIFCGIMTILALITALRLIKPSTAWDFPALGHDYCDCNKIVFLIIIE